MNDIPEKGWRPALDMRFAASLEAIALAVRELPLLASQAVPVGLIKAKGIWRAMAIFAPSDGHNRFVNETDGLWRVAYIPALLRAYPFMLRMEKDEPRLTLWPNVKSQPLGEGVEPFIVNGQPTERIRKTISFLLGVQEEIAKAHEPCIMLEKAGALLPWTPKGYEQPLELAGNIVHAVDVERFNALPDSAFLELRALGALGWLYAHMQSLPSARIFQEAPEALEQSIDNIPHAAPVFPPSDLPTDFLKTFSWDLGGLDL